MASLLDLAGYVQKQGELGRQRGEQSRIASLASQAYTAPRADRQSILGQMAQTSPDAALAQQKQFRQGDSDRMADLSRKAKIFVGMAESGNAQAVASLYPQIAQEARDLGLGDIPMEYNDTFLPGLKKFATILDGDQTSEVGVQSTYVDAQGNRVAILRDGSTRTLGQNAPNNQIIDTGNGFFGVNKGNLSASPVMVGGQPQQAPQPSLQAGLYQTPAGMVRIGEGLTPEQQQAALADIQAGGTAQNVQLPPRNVAPQQYGGGQQLRSAPKEEGAPAGFRRTADGNLEFIPGGPADPFVKNEVTGAQRAKLAATKQKEQQLLRANEAGIDQTITLIDSILSRKGDFGGVTGMGAMGARIPGTKWADLAAALDTLRGRSAFGALQQMRANSPTGGALGSVTERELGLLQNSETQLQNTQSPEALANGLEAYKRVLQETKRRMREGLDEFYQDSGSSPGGSQSGWSIQRVD